MASTPSTWSIPHYFHCFRLHLHFSPSQSDIMYDCTIGEIRSEQVKKYPYSQRTDYKQINKSIFQFHYLFQIRVAGDIFVSGENLPDFQDFQDNTCTMWVMWCMMHAGNQFLKSLYLLSRYICFGSLNFFLSFSIMYCLMFARFIYVRYADGLIQQGVRMFNIIVIVIIASLYGWVWVTLTNTFVILISLVRFLCSMTLDIFLNPGETIKEKICMLKNIEEFSIFTQENKDRREYSLKYKLILTILIFLFEISNQYFYHSAK